MNALAWGLGGTIGPAMVYWYWKARKRLKKGAPTNVVIMEIGLQARKTFDSLMSIAIATLYVAVLFAETLFTGVGDMFGVLGGQLAQYPLPLAHFGVMFLGWFGISNPGAMTVVQFLGIALVVTALAYMVKGRR